MADDLTLKIGVALDNLISGLGQAKAAVKDFTEAFVAGFAVKEIDDFVTKAAEFGTHIENLASQLGAPVEQVQELGVIAKAAGGSLEGIVGTLNRMEVGMIRGARATSQQSEAAKALGINIKAFMAAAPEERVLMLADAMHKFADGGTKTADVMLLAGRGAAQLIPVLDAGRAGILAWNAALKEQNAIVGEDTIKTLAQLDRNLTLVNAQFTALGNLVVAKMSPAWTGLATALGAVAKAFMDSVNNGGSMSTLLNGLSTGIAAFAAGLVASVSALETLWEMTKTTVFAIGQLFVDLGKIIYAAFTMDLPGIQAAWADLQGQLTTRVKSTATNIIQIWQDAAKSITKIYDGIGNAPGVSGPAAGAKQAPAANVNAGAAAKDALKAWDDYYQTLAIKSREWVETFQMTEAQRTAFLKAQLKIRENAEIASGMARSVAEAKYNKDVAKLDEETTKKVISDWKKVADEFASDFSSALDQVLTRQKTFSQAMGQMFGKMIEQMIAQVIKLILTWIILDIVSGGTTSFASVASQSGGIIGAIFSGGGKGFAEGTPYVKQTGLAFLHQGEAVLPATANPFTGANPGTIQGGGGVTLHIQTMDAGSFATWLRGGGGNMLTRYLSTAFQNNPSMRPGYTK